MSGQKHTGDIPPPVTAEKFLRTGSTEKKELQLDLKGIFFHQGRDSEVRSLVDIVNLSVWHKGRVRLEGKGQMCVWGGWVDG